MDSIYKWAENSELEIAFSLERFGRYIEWAGGNKDKAFQLYAQNTMLSEAFYTPLHILEVALRNRIHTLLSECFGEKWYDNETLVFGSLKENLQKAKDDLTAENRDHSPGRIVSVLTFGFWTGLLSPNHEDLWRSTLHAIATKEGGKSFARKDFTRNITPIRVLRNRIAHHEPILYWDLRKHHDHIMMLTEWLSPDAATWSRHHSRFMEVFPTEGIKLER